MTRTFMGELLRTALALGVIACWGAVFTLLLPKALRRTFALAIPVTGAAGFITVSHWLNPFMSSGTSGMVLSIGGLVALGVLAWSRRSDIGVGPRELLLMLLLCAAALPGVALTAKHLRSAEAAGLDFASPNHDGFYFSAVDDWLLHHRSSAVPSITSSASSADGPADGPAVAYQTFKRWGEGSLQTIPSAIAGGQTSDHWQLLTACWLMLWPGALYLLLRGWGAKHRSAVVGGLAGGAIATAFGMVSYAVLNQNGPLILGMGLMIAAVGSLGLYLRQDSAGPALAVVLAVPLVGWIGTYFEFAAVGVVLIAVLVVLQENVRTLALWRSLVVYGVSAVVIGVLPFLNAVRGTLVVGGAKPTWFSYFSGGTLQANAAKLLGLRPVDTLPVAPASHELFRVVLVAVLGIVVIGVAMVWKQARYSLLALIIVVGGFWYTQSRGDTNYTANRLILMLVVTVAMLSVGASAAVSVDWLRRRPDRPVYLTLAPLAAFALLAAIVIANSWHVVGASAGYFQAGRSVTAEDAEAVSWLRDLGGPAGGDVQIATTRYAKQLILMDRTRQARDTSWASLFRDYAMVTTFDSQDPPGYVLTDSDSLVIGHPVKVKGNGSWVLYRLTTPSAIVSPPSSLAQSQVGPQSVVWSGVTGDSAVAMSSGCPSFDLGLSSADHVAVTYSVSDDANSAAPTALDLGPAPNPLVVTRSGDGGLTLRVSSTSQAPVAIKVAAPATCAASGAG